MKLSFWSPEVVMEGMLERMVTGAEVMLMGLVTSLTGLPVRVVKLWMFIRSDGSKGSILSILSSPMLSKMLPGLTSTPPITLE